MPGMLCFNLSISCKPHKICIRKMYWPQFESQINDFLKSQKINLIKFNKREGQDLNLWPSEAKGHALSIMYTTSQIVIVLPHCLIMLLLYTQVYQEDDWVDSFIACMYININQYLLFSPTKSMSVLEADGLQIQKNQWIFD